MAEKNEPKERKCQKCGHIIIATAQQVKDHYEKCSEEPSHATD